MSIQEKAAETVRKLLRWTIEGKIQWDLITDTRWLTLGTDDLVSVAYIAEVAENRFVINEERYQTSADGESTYWDSDVTLRLVDEENVILWTFPRRLSGLYELYQQVQPQASQVEDRLNKVLEFKG